MGRPVGCRAKKWLDMDRPLPVCRPKRMKNGQFSGPFGSARWSCPNILVRKKKHMCVYKEINIFEGFEKEISSSLGRHTANMCLIF